jgi:hypothetical protein
MELEFVFNGSPEQFMEVAMVYTARRARKKDIYQWRVSAGSRFLKLRDMKNAKYTYAFIKAQSLPKEKTMLIVYLPDEIMLEVKPWLELFYNELIKQEWLALTSVPLENIPLKEPKKPDTRYPLDNWFDYYHNMQKAGKKYTLKQLAKEVGYAHSTIRYRHREYKIRKQR